MVELNSNQRFRYKKTKLKICFQVLTLSTLRKNTSFQLVERTMKFCINGKCTCNLKPGKIQFFIVKYANLWRACCYHRSGCLSSLTQPRRRPQQERQNIHICQRKTIVFHPLQVNSSFFYISQTFWFFLRRQMTCFAVVWATWAYDHDDKCSILSCYLKSAGSNLFPG